MRNHEKARAGGAGRRLAAGLAALLALSLTGPVLARSHPESPQRKLPALRLTPQEMAQQAADPSRWIERRGASLATLRERDHEIHRLLGPRMVSRRSLRRLEERGLGPALLEKGLAGLRALPTAADPDTLKVLLIRIGFETDESGDLTSVTTDGDFTFEDTEGLLFDPPPHDRNFYLTHLYGLSEYYRMQSGGRLVLDIHFADTGFDGERSTVLPLGRRDSYKLRDIADYGPNAQAFWSLDKLEELVRDMMVAADEGTGLDGSVDLSAFDDDNPLTYIIFVHAGGDWQSDVNFDSPNDIPTFFITLGEPQALPTSGGSLSECSVIPETTTQDGWLGSIAAALYHEFGHALGLADIYSTYNGWTVVGIWDLMDSGTNLSADIGFDDDGDGLADRGYSVTGLMPPSLGVWNKWFLGWLDAEVVDGPGATYRLPGAAIPRSDYALHRDAGYDFDDAYPQVLVAGASSREFFLVENRWVPLLPTDVPDVTGIGPVQDDSTGVITYMGGDPDEFGVYRNSGLYDFFLPATGLLVWHVNMDRIEEGLASNTVNIFRDGIRLVEADGIEDIGHLDDPYAWGRLGWSTDPFNLENGTTLSREGAPSSRAFDRAWTGVEMEYLGEVGGSGPAVVALEIGVVNLAPGSPLTLPSIGAAEAALMGGEPGPRALAPGSLTPWALTDGGDPYAVVALADAPGPAWGEDPYPSKLLVFRQDGTAAVPAAGIAEGPPGAAWLLGAPLAGPPAVVDLAGGLPPASPGLVVGLVDGTLLAFSPNLAAGQLDEVWERTQPVGPALACAPVPSGADPAVLLCCVPPDRLVAVSHTGTVLGPALELTGLDAAPISGFAAPPAAIPARDLPVGSEPAWAVFGDAEWFLVRFDEGQLAADPAWAPYPSAPVGTLRRAVIGRDDHWQEVARVGAEILILDDRGVLASWLVSDPARLPSPLTAGFTLDSAPAGEPLVADVDGDGRDDLVVLTAQQVHAYQAGGVPLTGFPVRVTELFPLPDTLRVREPAVVCDADGDGVNEILLSTDHGHLIGLDARGRLLPRTPFVLGSGEAAAMAVGPGPAGAEPGRLLWYAEAHGTVHPPRDRRHENGRLAAYRLPGSGTAAQGTSEWLGIAGGPGRDGPAGEPAALTVAAAPHRQEAERVVLYPNPCRGRDLTVRFYSTTSAPARLTVYNLEGEAVSSYQIAASADALNEGRIELPDLASGVYVCRLVRAGASGTVVHTSTLAIEK